MKRYGFILFLLIGTILPVFGVSAQSEFQCTLTTLEDVNIRSGPGAEFQILGSRLKDHVLYGNGQAQDTEGMLWWRIVPNKWVRQDLVAEEGDCAGLPIISPQVLSQFEVITPENASRLTLLGVMGDAADSVAFNYDGTLLVSAHGQEIYLWSVPRQNQVSRLPDRNERSGHLALSPIENVMAIVSPDEASVDVINIVNGKTVQSFSLPPMSTPFMGATIDVHFSPGGTMLAVTDNAETYIWDLLTGTEMNVSPNDECVVLCVPDFLDFTPGSLIFSADGRLVAADNYAIPEIQVWDVAKGSKVYSFISTFDHSDGLVDRGFNFGVHENIFAVTYASLKSPPNNGWIEIWDMLTRQTIAILDTQGTFTSELVFSPDGRLLVAANTGGVHWWAVSTS